MSSLEQAIENGKELIEFLKNKNYTYNMNQNK